MADPVILHADMDAFYASVEQRDRPELRGRPVIVGGTVGARRGGGGVLRGAAVRRALGDADGAGARAAARDAVFVPGDMAKYRRVSAQFRAVFDSVSPLVEPLSLDEAFIDVTGVGRGCSGRRSTIGRLLQGARARGDRTSRCRSASGRAKMVAKIASDLSKPDGLLEVPADDVRGVPASAARRPAVGRRAGDRGGAPMRPASRPSATSPPPIPSCAARGGRQRRGARCARLARGDDVRNVEPDRDAKSYGEEGTFAARRARRPDRCATRSSRTPRRSRAVCGTTACARGPSSLKIKLAERSGRASPGC